MDARETASERVTRRIAEEKNVDVLELPPLFDAVDPDALNDLVEGMEEGAITFDYADRTVTVGADCEVRIDDETRSPSVSEGEKPLC